MPVVQRTHTAPDHPRNPPGSPQGGRFAPKAAGESDVALGLDDGLDEVEDCSSCGADTSDGEGYDGYCGGCADVIFAHDEPTQ